ncbi:MAG: phage shock protein PspC (stress-responsive transcriptional regulator) [Polaribacter sp.]|jgi:phage shock protein PspC (stress-responsive transcriptional regulator)
MKISDNQITELYRFTREHFVVHYDVQTELVDHLANDIEQIWVEQPILTFREAKTISFKKFGVFGFMDVVEQKQKAMNKRYWKILLRFIKEWFTLPKIITTSLIFMLFFTVLQSVYAKEILFVSIFSLVIIDFYYLFKNRGKKKQKKEKIFLLESMIGETRNGFSALMFLNVCSSINSLGVDFHTLSIYWILLIAFFATLTCIVFYIIGFVIPSKAEELLSETYPEYKIL